MLLRIYFYLSKSTKFLDLLRSSVPTLLLSRKVLDTALKFLLSIIQTIVKLITISPSKELYYATVISQSQFYLDFSRFTKRIHNRLT